MDSAERAIIELKKRGNRRNAEGMSRFGSAAKNKLGVSIPGIRGIAKGIGKSHETAISLWSSGIHEARILASMVDDPKKVTAAQMDRWAGDFDSWDLCDQCCSNLFDKTQFAYGKAVQWSRDDREYVKRAGYVMMACLAVHDKLSPSRRFSDFMPLIVDGSGDERNFVKKAVNWALRQIGKRNPSLNRVAIRTAERISRMESGSARWIASDALRELRSHRFG